MTGSRGVLFCQWSVVNFRLIDSHMRLYLRRSPFRARLEAVQVVHEGRDFMLWVRRLFVMLAVVAVPGTSAHAQFFYPGGYGGWGWNGWGGRRRTVQGDVARGLGMFAEGAGIYNQQNRRGQFDQCRHGDAPEPVRLREGQQEANRRYHERLGRQREGSSRHAKRWPAA